MPTPKEITALRDTVFRAPENHNTPAVPATTISNPLITKIPVVTIPEEKATALHLHRAFHLFIIMAGTSSSTSRMAWQSYVATAIVACFPDMKAGICSNPVYVEKPLSPDAITALETWMDAYEATQDPENSEQTRKKLQETVRGMMIDIGLPMGVPSFDIDLADVLDLPSIYGHVSLILFIAGKTITDANRVALTQKRPGAIERKYFNGKVVASLSGTMKLSNTAHTYIHMAFVSMTHLRREVFSKVALFNDNAGDISVEIVATTTRLMRYAGMQQAIFVDQFLSGHEEAYRIPIVQPAIQAYTASMKDLMNAPVEQRPYYKVIHGDTTRAFNRNDISNLLAVALTEAREVNPTLVNYQIPANHQIVMEKYNKYLALLQEEDDSE